MRSDSEITVRRAAKADVPALGKLGEHLVQVHYRLDNRRFLPVMPQTAERYGAFLGTQIERNDAVLFVAERDGAVVGYAYAGLEDYDYMALRGPAGALYDLVVDPNCRRRGIGTLLLNAALDWLRAQNAPRVVLSTAEGNDEAQRLFASAGFRRTMIEMTRESP